MARIRTIKPEFWTDEKIIQLSPLARLLFLGMWNYADDHGGIEASEPQLKMRILPADPVDIHDLLKELLAHGLLIEYSVNDARYYHIKNFPKHQKINRPSNPRVPPYTSLSPHGGLTEVSSREGKGSGMEGKRKGSGSGSGRETTNSTITHPALGAGADRSQVQDNDNPHDSQIPEESQLMMREAMKQITTLTAPKDENNGRGVSKVKSPKDEFIDSTVDPVQRKALLDVIVNGGDMTLLDKMRHLYAAGMSKENLGKARTLILEPEEAAGTAG